MADPGQTTTAAGGSPPGSPTPQTSRARPSASASCTAISRRSPSGAEIRPCNSVHRGIRRLRLPRRHDTQVRGSPTPLPTVSPAFARRVAEETATRLRAEFDRRGIAGKAKAAGVGVGEIGIAGALGLGVLGAPRHCDDRRAQPRDARVGGGPRHRRSVRRAGCHPVVAGSQAHQRGDQPVATAARQRPVI